MPQSALISSTASRSIVCTLSPGRYGSKSGVPIGIAAKGGGEQDRPASELQRRAGRLFRFAARREEAGGLCDVDVRDEQPWIAVGLIAEQSPVGPHHR